MTETQLKLYPVFRTLPVYDESDERSHSLPKRPGAGQGARECTTLAEVETCLANPKLTPLGAVRCGDDGKKVVVVYFAEVT